MRVCLSTFGSRGDVQPLVALAVELQALGVEARVCAPPDREFAQLTARVGVTLVPAFSPIREWVKERLDRKVVDRAAAITEVMTAQLGAITTAAEGCDVLVFSGVFSSAAAARSVAEKLGMRHICVAFCPLFLPSLHHRPHEYPDRPYPPGVTDNRALWDLDIQTMNAMFSDVLNTRRASIGLPAVSNVRDYVLTNNPWLAADPALAPWQLPTPLDVTQTGAWLLPDERQLPAELVAFLDAGTPPVYVGFGSMPQRALRDVARTTIEAIRAGGRRALVFRGWADVVPVDDGDDCFVIDEVNQAALFRRVAAVIHHGGAGTTTTAARAGAPQVIVPQIMDQHYWAGRVVDMAIGVRVASTPTAESLSAALQTALAPEMHSRAATVASSIRIDGAAVAARMLVSGIGK